MEKRVEELETKVGALEASITKLQMSGAGSVNEAMGALRAELKKEIRNEVERLEKLIRSTKKR